MNTIIALLMIGPMLGQSPAPPSGSEDESGGAALERPAYDPQATTKAVAFWTRRTERDAQSPPGWTELARAYLARHHQTGSLDDAKRAEQAARRALGQVAASGTSVILGRALLSQHRFPEALKVAERAARVDPSANALLCDVLIELGRLDEARIAFSKFPGTDPLDRIALEARMLEAQGDSDALIDRLRELTGLADRMPQLPAELAAWYHVRLGHALIDRGRLPEGREACRAALGIVPGEHAALVGLAEAEAAEGRWAEALRLAEEAERNAPADFEAVHLVARARSALGRAGEADRAFARLKSMVQGSPRIYDRLYARACVAANRDLELALACAECDLSLRRDARGYETLALVLDRLGRNDRARPAIEAARALDPGDPDIRRHADEILGRAARAATNPANPSAAP
jgi:tetratricopeptide (TPR) repeat protein